jgi:hypothetical protein
MSKKIISFANLNGNFSKFVEVFMKIKEKSGGFDLVILTGKVFDPNKNFSELKELEILNSKILIFDNSEVGVVCKHKLLYDQFHYSDNVTILGRSGVYVHENIRICYLSGKENKKYLDEDAKYKYTSCFFSRDDIDKLFELSRKDGGKIDIFLTHSLPSIVHEELTK